MDKYPNDVHFPMEVEEQWKVRERIKELEKQGLKDEAEKLLCTLPLWPSTAYGLKQVLGLKFLIANKVNLWDALQKFGPDFLEKP